MWNNSNLGKDYRRVYSELPFLKVSFSSLSSYCRVFSIDEHAAASIKYTFK